jgi:2-C-methyl-D-erythritol 2,4-cyclodiphosphate synthase
MTELRVGNGFDIHAFCDEPGRRLVLGGVVFPDERPLRGHSDADVIAHAVGEALLGAAGLEDLGHLFPDDDPRWEGADSVALLGEIRDLIGREGWRVCNVDCSVVAETPRLAPHREVMQDRLSRAVGGPVSIKGRRAESLGALGRREGIACWATALLERDR